MRWSWTFARIAGINVDIHATFLILLAWIAVVDFGQGRSVNAAIAGVLLTLAIFASVLLHEFGHALTAARFGVKTRSITLLPIGGVARLERIPDKPRQELLIALAGPAVTIAIVAVLFLVLRVTGGTITPPATRLVTSDSFVAQVMWVNVMLAVFNLLPAFPMDGGRVLRAALAMRMPYVRATEIAAWFGKIFAALFGVIGLVVLNNPFLVVIAVFIWLSAAGEFAMVQMKASFGDATVARIMITDVRTLSATLPISAALDAVRTGFQHDFPVVEDHGVVGILTRERLLKALADGHTDAMVGDIMERSFSSTTPEEPIGKALERLQTCRCQTLVVMRGTELAGLLAAEKISDFVMFASAERAGHAQP